MLLVSSGSGIGYTISLLIVGLAVSFVVSKNGIGYAYLAFASSESRCCSFFLGQRPRARHRFSYSQPRGVVCRLGKRPCVRLSAFVFVGLAVLHVSSGSGIVCAISSLIASLAVSSVFSDGGLVCAYQLSESIPYELVRGADFHHFGDNSGANFASLKGYSSSPDAAFMISAYNLQLARAGARSWTDYVPSDLNLADLPTRPDLPEWPGVRDYIGAAEIDFVFPSLSEWATW